MADIRSSQNIAQVEWAEPADIRSSQSIAQIEWTELAEIRSSQVIAQVEFTESVGWVGKVCGVTNPAKIMGVAVADIASVMGVS